MRHPLLITILLLSLSLQLHATAQIAERIFVDGVAKSLLSLPIEQDSILRNALDEVVGDHLQSTACYRNYKGTWLVEDECLYLLELTDLEGRAISPPDAFLPYKEGNRYQATWFSGELRVGEGAVIYHSIQNLGFSYYFAGETFYTLCQGRVTEAKAYENRFLPAEHSFEESLKRITAGFDFHQFPELATQHRLILQFQILPTAEGKIDRFTRLQLLFRTEGTSVTLTDPDHPYLREIISLFHQIPQWDVLFLYGELQPLPAYFLPFINRQAHE